MNGLDRDAAAAADVYGLELAGLEQLVDLRLSDAEGLGGFDRGDTTGTAPIAVRPLV